MILINKQKLEHVIVSQEEYESLEWPGLIPITNVADLRAALTPEEREAYFQKLAGVKPPKKLDDALYNAIKGISINKRRGRNVRTKSNS